MALLQCCDRCKSLAVECITVLGRDLCARCVADFDGWMETGPERFRPAKADLLQSVRNPPEASLAVFRVLAAADRNGRVHARAFSESVGESYRASYYRMRHLCRLGMIDRVAGSVYRLPAALESEAVE